MSTGSQNAEARIKALEAELESVRGAFQDLIERAPFGVHRYDLSPDGKLVFAGGNPAADRILGIEHARLVGLTIEEAFPPLTSGPLPDAYRRAARTGERYEDEQTSYQDDHITGAFEIHAFQTAPDRMAVMFRDITERRRAEAALRAKTEELDHYFSGSLDLLCISDAQGRFKRVNPAWESTLGWKVEELEGRHLMELVHPDDVQATLAAVSALSRQEPVQRFTNRQRCKDGSYRWIEWRSFPEGEMVYAVARDVTERVRAEAALRVSQERLQAIFRASPVGIGVSSNRHITDANDRLCELTGYSREELIGRETSFLYPDQEEYARVGSLMTAEEMAKAGRIVAEVRWRRRDGEVIDIMLSATFLDPSDPSAGATFAALDVTERKREEKERRLLETRMQQSQKLESLGVLAGGIAHDFNNILMAVLGHADLAQAGLSPLSPARESIQEIERAARRAADLCRQMLAYSGKGRFVVQALDLSEVVQEMLHMLQVSISKKAALRLNLAAGLPPVEADVAQLRQVVMNLVINASEAIGDSPGVISLSTGVADCDRAYLDGAWMNEQLSPGRYVTLDVTDTGCGMDRETQKRIFDPFFTTKFTGRGLGLAAVIGIVRGHRGAIKVYSEVGRGTSFKILLPASAGAVQHITSPQAAADSWRGSGTVLLVEDEEGVRSIARKMLERLGFQVAEAANGREAIARYREAPEQFRCVLMDLTMPEMDGEEAYRELRRISPDVKVFLTSGYNEQEATQRFVGKGLAGFIQKPYLMGMLGKKLRSVLDPAPGATP